MTTFEIGGSITPKNYGNYTGDEYTAHTFGTDYSYKAWLGHGSREIYIYDIDDDTYTFKDICLKGILEVSQREKSAIRTERRISSQVNAQMNLNPSDMPYSHRSPNRLPRAI